MAEIAALFGSLRGEQCNAVSFVMDYVEIHFNGQLVRALANPVVERNGERHAFPAAASRDALCSLIGDTVIATEGAEGSTLRLEFASGARLTVPLGVTDRVGPEALHFMKDGQFVVIW